MNGFFFFWFLSRTNRQYNFLFFFHNSRNYSLGSEIFFNDEIDKKNT